VVVFNLSHNSYQSLLQNFARQLKVKPQNNSIIIPSEIGEGVIKVIQLPNGLQALMIKILFHQDVQIKQGNINEGDYVLNFDESEMADKKKISSEKVINSFVRLTGSSFRHWEVMKKKSSIQFLKILFSKEWLSNYIGLGEKISLFENYIPIKLQSGEKEKLNEDYRQIIDEMWNTDTNEFLQNMFYQNRILLLIEQFFTQMHTALLNPKGKYKLTTEDVEILKKVEIKLNTFTATPPKIELLAKKYAMGKVRLAQAFKQVYGISIYNYYQKQRMQKAHELLSTQKLSVNEAAKKLGYSNLSNFILAFKKQFNTEPKNLAV
jgi:AraC-like DNA-binding protein